MTMIEAIKSTEQLSNEVSFLRQANQVLSAELAFHRNVFRELHSALGAADDLDGPREENEALRKLLAENLRLKNQLKISKLSDREREVLRFILHGYTSKDIADKLNLSKLTVDTHRKNIQQKLEVSNMVELVRMALDFDLR